MSDGTQENGPRIVRVTPEARRAVRIEAYRKGRGLTEEDMSDEEVLAEFARIGRRLAERRQAHPPGLQVSVTAPLGTAVTVNVRL